MDRTDPHRCPEWPHDSTQRRATTRYGSTRQLDAWQREAIAGAREDGASWFDIGDAPGVTKQAPWASDNEDVREVLATGSRSELTDEDAQQLADEARGAPRSSSTSSSACMTQAIDGGHRVAASPTADRR